MGPAGLTFAGAFCAMATMLSQTAPANAQTGEFQCPPTNAVLRFSTGSSLESAGEAGQYICRFKNVRTGKLTDVLLGAFSPAVEPIKGNLAKIQSLVHFQVGRSVTFESSGAGDRGFDDGAWHVTLSVEKMEQVTVPAGTFLAYVVLYDEQSGRAGGRWQRRYWYAPQIGGYAVRYEYQAIRGRAPAKYPQPWTLVEYTPAPGT